MDPELDDLMNDVQTFATRWVGSVGHFRAMTDKAFDDTTPYDADSAANDVAVLTANFWRDAAALVNVTSRAMAIAARRGTS